MNPSIQQLRVFVAVAHSRSLAEASERVHLSQPAISIALRKLEENVGGALFARTSRQLTLTPEGDAFLPVAVRLLNDWNEAFEDLNDQFSKQRGKVTVAALPTLAAGLFPRVITLFHEAYPRINLSLHDVLAEQINQMVREGRADLGLSVPPGDADDLTFEPVLEDSYVATRCWRSRPWRGVSWLPIRLLVSIGFPVHARILTASCRVSGNGWIFCAMRARSPRWAAWWRRGWVLACCPRSAFARLPPTASNIARLSSRLSAES